MNEVIAVLRGAQREITGAKDFECACDEAAIEQARQLVDGHDIELYEHGRFITWYRHQIRPSQPTPTNPQRSEALAGVIV